MSELSETMNRLEMMITENAAEIKNLEAENVRLVDVLGQKEHLINLIIGGPMPITAESLRGMADWIDSQ